MLCRPHIGPPGQQVGGQSGRKIFDELLRGEGGGRWQIVRQGRANQQHEPVPELFHLLREEGDVRANGLALRLRRAQIEFRGYPALERLTIERQRLFGRRQRLARQSELLFCRNERECLPRDSGDKADLGAVAGLLGREILVQHLIAQAHDPAEEIDFIGRNLEPDAVA